MKVRLDEICSINMGQSPDSSSYNDNGEGLPFFQGNADFGDIHPQVRVWCNSPTKIANTGDILISVRAPIGALNIANTECCIGRGLAALRVDESICDKKYVWYAISSKVDELNEKGTGSTFKAISKGILSETEIPIISLQKQAEIGKILDAIFHLIALRKEQLKKLDELVKARFVEMFRNEQRHMQMRDICSIITDGTHQPPRFSTEGIPFIFVSNITRDIVSYEAEKYIDQATYDELIKRTPIEIGDILLSTVGSYGHPAVVKSDKKFLFQRHIAYLKPIRDVVDSDYLHSAILSPEVQQQIEEGVKGIAQKTLNLSDIKKMTVPVPPMEEQKAFTAFLTQVDESKAAVRKGLEQLETLKRALMQEYFG